MRYFVLIGCFVMLLIALPFITSRLKVQRGAGIAQLDAIPTLEHDWTVGNEPGLVGLVGYPSGTYVCCYEAGYFWVPIPAPSLVLLVVIAFFGTLYFLVSSFRGHDEIP